MFLFGSLTDRTSRPTSLRRRPFLTVGVRPAHFGPRVVAIRSSSSKTTVPSSILPCAAIGPGLYGQRLVFPAKIRAARSERVSRRASSSCNRMARRFPKHVRPIRFHCVNSSSNWLTPSGQIGRSRVCRSIRATNRTSSGLF